VVPLAQQAQVWVVEEVSFLVRAQMAKKRLLSPQLSSGSDSPSVFFAFYPASVFIS
jgi:hypothetical protein